MRTRFSSIFYLVLTLFAVARGSWADVTFEILQTDGSLIFGSIGSLGETSMVVNEQNDGPRTLDLKDIFSVAQKDRTTNSLPAGDVIVFPGGDRLAKSVGNLQDEKIETSGGVVGVDETNKNLAIPFTAIAGIVFANFPEALRFNQMATIRKEARKSDKISFSNGDSREASFVGLDKTLDLSDKGQKFSQDRSQVSSLAFESTLLDYPPFKDTSLEVSLLDGSRVGLAKYKVENDHLKGETRFHVQVAIPLDSIARIIVRQPTLIFLSESTPVGKVYQGYIGSHFEKFGQDETLKNTPLTIGKQTYEHGLSTQPLTYLSYLLPAKARYFQALLGQDEKLSGDRGSFSGRVALSKNKKIIQQIRFENITLSKPQMINVDVSNADSIILVTEFGERGDVQDYANWADARFIAAP